MSLEVNRGEGSQARKLREMQLEGMMALAELYEGNLAVHGMLLATMEAITEVYELIVGGAE